jgi:hypothetical protein
MPIEYKSEEEALKDVAKILNISPETLGSMRKGPSLFEGFEQPRWLDVYQNGENMVGVGYCRQIYTCVDGGSMPGYGLWLIDKNNNIERVCSNQLKSFSVDR